MVINLLRSWKRIRVPQRLKKHLLLEMEWGTLQGSTVTSDEEGCRQIPGRLIPLNLKIACIQSSVYVIPVGTHHCYFPVWAGIHFESFPTLVSPWKNLLIAFNVRISGRVCGGKKKNRTCWKDILFSPEWQYVFNTMPLVYSILLN